MPRVKDIKGQRFNMLVVLGRGALYKNRAILWRCKCDCGNERLIDGTTLRRDLAFSCGCANRHKGQPPQHGHALKYNMSATYRAWAGMKARCANQGHHKYPIYGGRGIKVCPRWTAFENFLLDMGEKPSGTSLERIDVDGDYTPSNCKWATAKEQANNKRNNRLITHNGVTRTLSQWADSVGISFVSLRMRLHRGWPIERALTP